MKPMRIVSFLGSAALLGLGALGMPGCSSTVTVNDGGDTDSGTKTDSGGGGDSGSDSMAQKMVSCSEYCSTFKTNCAGKKDLYPDDASCMAVCMALPMGTNPVGSDTGNNTVSCRQYHAGAAAMDSATHCPHAGAYGGGACGTACDALCTIASKICTGNLFPFTGMNECLSKCGLWATSGMTGDAMGNTLQCREYHLLVASQSTANAMMHCSHIADMNTQCK